MMGPEGLCVNAPGLGKYPRDRASQPLAHHDMLGISGKELLVRGD